MVEGSGPRVLKSIVYWLWTEVIAFLMLGKNGQNGPQNTLLTYFLKFVFERFLKVLPDCGTPE